MDTQHTCSAGKYTPEDKEYLARATVAERVHFQEARHGNTEAVTPARLLADNVVDYPAEEPTGHVYTFPCGHRMYQPGAAVREV